jgi:formylglycine-generating enzyme required for sulfatase activity
MNGCCSAIGRNVSQSATSLQEQGQRQHRGERGPAILVRGGPTFVGTAEPQIAGDGEGPERKVDVGDFLLEAETVSVERFAAFVSSTGYVTEAETFGCSAVFTGLFKQTSHAAAMVAETPWWARIDHAIWNMPEGQGSSAEDRMDHPVTQVSWNDAMAFAAWVGGRLPTEAEWEHAARGGNRRRRYPWGDAEPADDKVYCNIWQGHFPHENTLADGFFGTAPVRSFVPTEDGFYNLAGNVWEWTSDSFRVRSLSRLAKARNEQAKVYAEKVLKGGSFLCHKSYCYRYRVAARMGLSPDSASSNTGFRIAYNVGEDSRGA